MPKIGQTTKALTSAAKGVLIPYWQTTDGRACRLYLGNVTEVLARLPARSVHCCVTSPPYWGLRDYSACGCRIHVQSGTGGSVPGNSGAIHVSKTANPSCRLCGGTGKVLGMETQIGSEPSPDCGTHGQAQCGRCFVCAMVAVFRGVRRVLRDDGTCWLNLGDSYSSSPAGNTKPRSEQGNGEAMFRLGGKKQAETLKLGAKKMDTSKVLPSGNLVGVPWRVALALQADGWVLRQDVIWAKPSPMPESVTNRCTKAHEYVFLLTKRAGYYCDMEAVKDSAAASTMRDSRLGATGTGRPRYDDNGDAACPSGMTGGAVDGRSNKRSVWSVDDETALARWLVENGHDAILAEFIEQGRNKGDVWRVSAQGYPGAHFATYPPKLIEPCILAGTSAKGCCPRCGAPWGRVAEKEKLRRERPNEYTKRTGEQGTGNSCGNGVAGVGVTTTGWAPGCDCPVDLFGEPAPPVPCTVLDPFMGSGTTAAVCADLGRRSVGIDLSEKYLLANAIPRISGTYLARPATVRLVPAAVHDMSVLSGGEEC